MGNDNGRLIDFRKAFLFPAGQVSKYPFGNILGIIYSFADVFIIYLLEELSYFLGRFFKSPLCVDLLV